MSPWRRAALGILLGGIAATTSPSRGFAQPVAPPPSPPPPLAPPAPPAPPPPSAPAPVAAQAAPARVAAPGEAAEDIPFYDPGTMVTPPVVRQPREPEPSSPLILALQPRVTRLVVPDLSSSATFVETSLFVGTEWIGGSVGYANVAGSNGVAFGVGAFRFVPGVKLLDGNGFRLSLVPPTLDARFIFLPGGSTGDKVLAASTDALGIRFCKCAGSFPLVVTARGPTLSGGFLTYADGTNRGLYGVGAALDIGMGIPL